jgi:hypothetical protein
MTRGSVERRPDSDSSPSLARGLAGPTRQCEKRGREEEAGRMGKVGPGKLLGRTEEKERGEGKEARGLGCAGRERNRSQAN